MSETTTLERPEINTTPSENAPKFFHYVCKDKIVESAVIGNYVVALCGEVFQVTRSPKPGSPVCPECQDIYSNLRPE